MDDFKDAPISLAEIRATKESNASLLPPRDGLISLLKDIDNGENITHLVVCYRVKNEKGYRTRYLQAGGDSLMSSLGLISRCAHLMNSDA